MKIIVFLLFQFPTGHLKVAEVLEEEIKARYPDCEVEIIDFLSFCSGTMGKMVSKVYMDWINAFPAAYGKFYSALMYKEPEESQKINFSLFSLFFEGKMLKLLEEEKPDLVICSHSFPSRIIAKLKNKNQFPRIPTLNVYTDFFVSDIWGRDEIDYHFVPHQKAGRQLALCHNIPETRIFTTGIPVGSAFTQFSGRSRNHRPFRHILLAGGNNGLIDIRKLACLVESWPNVEFTILCGNNEELFGKLEKLNSANIHPKRYISCRNELSRLYDEADAIVTKPGGVTISEALRKRVPIFINGSLPGQEEVNLQFLLEEGIAFQLPEHKPLEYILSIIEDDLELNKVRKKMEEHLLGLEFSYGDALNQIIREEAYLRRTAEALK